MVGWEGDPTRIDTWQGTTDVQVLEAIERWSPSRHHIYVSTMFLTLAEVASLWASGSGDEGRRRGTKIDRSVCAGSSCEHLRTPSVDVGSVESRGSFVAKEKEAPVLPGWMACGYSVLISESWRSCCSYFSG